MPKKPVETKAVRKLWKVSIFLWLMIFRNIWIKTILMSPFSVERGIRNAMKMCSFFVDCEGIAFRNLWLMNWSIKCRFRIECRRGIRSLKHNDYIKVFHFSFLSAFESIFPLSIKGSIFNVASLMPSRELSCYRYCYNEFSILKSFILMFVLWLRTHGTDVLTILEAFHGKLFMGERLICN